VQADGDAQAFDLAIDWAASLLLAADDDVFLAIRLPSGAFNTFARKISEPKRSRSARSPGASPFLCPECDDARLGQNLTAAQAHLIVGEVLDRITLPRPAKTHSGQS
jgi:hypothetical protein